VDDHIADAIDQPSRNQSLFSIVGSSIGPGQDVAVENPRGVKKVDAPLAENSPSF